MKDFKLTDEEIITLRIAHSKEKKRKKADRIKAVLLLGTGWSNESVCEALLLEDDTLRNYVKKYREGGIKLLVTTNYKGSSAKLTSHQIKELDAHLQENTYLTVESIIAYVAKTYKEPYRISGMTDMLHRLGFRYKKAKLVPAKADKEQQKQFLEDLEQVSQEKGEDDPILYMDGVHPQHNTMPAYGWVKKGEDKLIKSNTGRKRVNINGVLDSQTHEVITRSDDSINAQSTIKLLKQVEEAYPLANVIYIVCDNARYYRSKLVNEYLEASKVKLLFLPSYSPNLNLIERLWKFMKKKVLYNKYYEKYADFKNAVMGFFEEIDEFRQELDSLLTNNFQLLDAEINPKTYS